MAILTATDARYMILYKRCPSYLVNTENTIKEAIKNDKTEARIVLPSMPDIDEETKDDSDNFALICYQNSHCNVFEKGNWFSDLAEALEHPEEEWFLQEKIDQGIIKKVLESYAFKSIIDKALLASYLVELGYKVTTDPDEFFDTNFLTISWV